MAELKLPNGKMLRLDWEERNPFEFCKALREAHGRPRRPLCLCRGDSSGIEVVVRRLAPDDEHPGRERFVVARMPNTGHQHISDCQFYAQHPERSGLAGYVDGVVRASEDAFHLRLSRGLTIRRLGVPVAEAGAAPAEPRRRGAQRQRAMSALGLLHFLWQEAGINEWYPNPDKARNWSRAGDLVTGVAQRIVCGRTRLDRVLVVVGNDNVYDVIEDCLEARLVVIVGELKSIDGDGRRIWIKSAWGTHRLLLVADSDQCADLEQRFAFPSSLLRPREAEDLDSRTAPRVVGLFVANVKEKADRKGALYEARLLEGALMATTTEYTPVESSFELEVANKLCQQSRFFIKPLRYDAGSDLVFPDFELLDCSRKSEIPMEVFGLYKSRVSPTPGPRGVVRLQLARRMGSWGSEMGGRARCWASKS